MGLKWNDDRGEDFPRKSFAILTSPLDVCHEDVDHGPPFHARLGKITREEMRSFFRGFGHPKVREIREGYRISMDKYG